MTSMPYHPPQGAAYAWRRGVIPALALAAFGAMALLWVSGRHAAYFGLLDFVGIGPFRFPFVDTHGVLAAAECARRGIDVYLSNPCDVLGRVHIYSPLWLSLTPGFLGTADTPWVGTAVDLLFLLSLGVALRPQSTAETAIFALAVFSPMTLFAVERANVDVVIFVLLLGASVLYGRSRPARLACYGLVLIAGLLKYYPLVLLILIARERWRNAVLPILVAGGALAAFIVSDHHEILATFAHIPSGVYFTNTFAAHNLVLGMAELTGKSPAAAVAAYAAMAGLAIFAVLLTRRNLRVLDTAVGDWRGAETTRLGIGSLLVSACFFAGTNADYRGIYLLFVVAGLAPLARTAQSDSSRQWFIRLIAVVLLVMWEEFFRVHLDHGLGAFATPSLRWSGTIVFWLGRELLWWWLIAALVAIALSYLRGLPLIEGWLAELRALRPAALR